MMKFTRAACVAGLGLCSGICSLPALSQEGGAGPAAPQPAAAAAPAESSFDILEFEVVGNTVLGVIAIEQAVTPFLGPGKLIADVEAARAALEKAYQGAGYLTVFVDVPEQRVDGGVVRLQVIEGRVDRLAVSGSRYYSQGVIREKVAELSEGNVPNFNQVQRELALVNRSEGRRVQPVLKPGKFPGTVEVDLKVADQLPVSGSVEINNQHPADTEPLRLQASLRYENLFQREHTLGLTAITAPQEPSQSKVFVANYAVPLDNGHTVVGYGVSSNSTVASLGGTTVLGKGTTLGLRYAIPFFARDGSSHSLTLGADYKDLEETVRFGDSDIATPLRYLPMQASYTGNWAERGSLTQISTTFVFAARRILDRKVDCPGNVGPVDQFACKRLGADGGFSTLRADVRHTEVFDWGSATLRLAGQFATQPLAASSEQFSIGGFDTVRGYLEGEGQGDDGALASFELRSPNWGPSISSWLGSEGEPVLRDFALHAFVDAGRVRIQQPAAGQAARTPLLGSGFGLRVGSRQGLNGSLDFAWAGKTTRSTESGDLRVHARLGLKF